MLARKDTTDAERWLVVGLGNPGDEYAATRHNAGFRVVDAVAGRIGANYWKSECGALVAQKEWRGRELVLAKPQTFMNLSGASVAQLAKKHGIAGDRLVVVHDELDIPAGTIRIKSGGGHGGHNGLKSIFEKLGTRDFARVRIGIGRPPGRMDAADYVLRAPRGDAADDFDRAVSAGVEAVPFLIENGLSRAQGAFN